MKRREFVGTGLSAAICAAMPNLRIFVGEAPLSLWGLGDGPEYFSSVPPPGYEIPGKTERYVFPSWQSDETFRSRAYSIVGMVGENVAGLALNRLRDAAVESKMGDILPLVADRIAPGQTGYLLRVNLVREPTGRLYPAPNLITAIGPGVEPVDALAEFLLQPSIGAMPQAGVREHHYRWCTRSDDSMEAACVPIEVGTYLEARAEVEAIRRRALGSTAIERRDEALRHLERGREFMDQWERRRAEVHAQYERARLDALVRSFIASEQRFNAAFSDYQRAERQAAEHAKEAAMLSALSGVMGAANMALQRRSQLRGDATGSPEEQSRWQAHQVDVMRQAAESSRAGMTMTWPNVERLDTQLRAEWVRLGETPLAPIVPPLY